MKVGFTHESQNAASTDWYTPSGLFQALVCWFDMDTCGPKGGVPWLPANKTLSIEDNGLTSPWEGFVWCNPPYGKETPLWLSKMKDHNNGIALVFARTDTKWFHDYVKTASCIVFLEGRIKFVDAFGKTGGSGAGNGSMLVGYGKEATKVLRDAVLLGRLKGMFVKCKE